ncbi:hypothetical protein RF11_06977 [Thelohanellus kitauei]|uniref:Uncharacterized protein n=1 Tax=Thelohanellus kitauei TaxID=669202 RepID=A0A0C2M3Q0_THEKT|nr:hypothetical protein RF11_00401 [Thelohanellus kitauei]KII70622.1 hypothetical protein RF11_06977 [Thelohanellus kitauei]
MNFLIVEITLLFWRRKECSEPKFDLGVFEQSSRTRVDNCSYYREIATLKRSRNSSNHSLRICWAESIINLCKAKLGQQEYRRSVGLLTVKVFIYAVTYRPATTLYTLILRRIEQRIRIIVDRWSEYLNLEELGYFHQAVVNQTNFADSTSGVHTNRLEGKWHRI